MKVAFLVNDLQLSGGVGVVIEHARRLAHDHGFEVSLVVVREQEEPHWKYEQLAEVEVLTREEAVGRPFDIAVATWWETTFSLFQMQAERYAYFIQSLEDRFYKREDAERIGASMTLDLPVAFITEATWIADILAGLRPDAPCHLVRNGIDKEVFAPVSEAPVRSDGPLRVLIEGNPTVWFKGVPEALHTVQAMSEPHHVTLVTSHRGGVSDGLPAVDRLVGPVTHREMAELYRESDVVLKLSKVEGMYGPPLEGFHMGATCVTTPVTGHEMYIEHGWNALVCEWDDVAGAAHQLDLLARDRQYLHFLRTNALATAKTWPSWAQSSQFMALALHRISREPAPSAEATAAAMLGDLRGHVEVTRALLAERREYQRQLARVNRVKALPGVRQARTVWRSERVQRRAGPLIMSTAKKALRR